MNNEDFQELAILDALGILDESESSQIKQITDSPEVEAELAQWQATAAALSYAVPQMSLDVDLKERLFQRIQSQAEDPNLTDQAQDSEITESLRQSLHSVRVADQIWKPHEFVPGIKVALLHLDMQQGEVVYLLKADPGVHYPLHRHSTPEDIYIMQGELSFESTTVVTAGDYIRLNEGVICAPWTETGCMLWAHSSIDEFISDPSTVTPNSTLNPSVVRSSELNWQPHPLVSGVSVGLLHVDMSTGEYVALIRGEAGVSYPAHRHSNFTEEILMLEGDLTVAGTTFTQGDYIRPGATFAHDLYSQTGCLILMHSTTDEFVDPILDNTLARV